MVDANIDVVVVLSMVILDIHARVSRRMVDNDESGALTADVAIAISSRSVMVLCLLLPF